MKRRVLVARAVLQGGIDQAEHQATHHGGVWGIAFVRFLGEVARLMGEESIVQRSEALLASTPLERFGGGSVQWESVGKRTIDGLRAVPSDRDLSVAYPLYSARRIRRYFERVAQHELHIACCLQDDWAGALTLAIDAESNERRLLIMEEVALSRAVLGEPNDAFEMVEDWGELWANARRSKRLLERVGSMELFRRTQDARALALMWPGGMGHRLFSTEDLRWVLGVMGYEPWDGYPFVGTGGATVGM